MPWVAFDNYAIVGIVLMLVTFVSFVRVANHQYKHVKKSPGSFRMAVLSLRAAAVIPGFAICYWLSLMFPNIYAGMQLPEAFLQAYCVYCFFAMIAYYVGGPAKCIDAFRVSTHTFPDCMFGCMNRTPERCYYHAYLAVWQFMFVRPVTTVIVIIAYYAGQNDLSLLISALTTMQAAWGVGGLVKFYHVLYDYCKGLNMTKKIFVIKTIIGLILFQAFLEQVLFYFGFINVEGDGLSSFSAADNAIRFYCFAVLVELVVFCVLVERTFAYDINVSKGKNFGHDTGSPAADVEGGNHNDTNGHNGHQNADRDSGATATSTDYGVIDDMNFCGFMWHLCRVWDVFDGGRLKKELLLANDYHTSNGSFVHSSGSHNRPTLDLSDYGDGSNHREMVEGSNPSMHTSTKSIVAMVDFKPSDPSRK
jgi:hypothetical protein